VDSVEADELKSRSEGGGRKNQRVGEWRGRRRREGCSWYGDWSTNWESIS